MELQAKIAKITADKEIAATIANAATKMVTSMTPWGAISDAIKGHPTVSDTKIMLTNAIDKEISKLSSINISNKCVNITDNTQTNSLVQTPECTIAQTARLDSVCSLFTTDAGKLQCIEKVMKDFTISNVTQSNKITANKTCNISAIIEETSKITTDTTIQALMSVMQKSSGGAATSNTANCTSIKENISEETYKNAQSCCLNKSNNIQRNEILCKGGININQSNEINDVSNCMMKLGISTSTDIASTTLAKTDIVIKQDATAPSTLKNIMYLLLAGTLLFGIIGFVIWYIKNRSNNSTETSLESPPLDSPPLNLPQLEDSIEISKASILKYKFI